MTTDSLKPCLLIYDIPDRANVANPSPRLRRRAVRVNLSCWVIPESEVPYHLLHEMELGGATWHVVRFADDEVKNLVRMAREAILQQTADAERRAKRSVEQATERVTNDAENGAADAAEKKFRTRTGAAVRRVKVLLGDLKMAAERFGIGDAGTSLSAALASVNAAHAAASARARLVAEAAREAAKVGDGRMGEAAAADLVPALILADYVEENGGDAEAMRLAFSDS
jgi:hypothetical protein